MRAQSKLVQVLFFTLLACGVPVYGAEPFADFTFKRIKPPASGVKKRITIQVVDQPVATDGVVSVAVAQDGGLSNWFWDNISPDLTAAAAGRFQLAINQLSSAPPGAAAITPRLEGFRSSADKYGTQILLATLGTKISPALVLAVIQTGSQGDSAAIGANGAIGLMQLSPISAAELGVGNPLDVTDNIKGGVTHLQNLLKVFDGDPILALAAYHTDAATLAEYGGVPPFADTRAFVPNIVAAFQVARALCLTPPELFSDGCVFALKESN